MIFKKFFISLLLYVQYTVEFIEILENGEVCINKVASSYPQVTRTRVGQISRKAISLNFHSIL